MENIENKINERIEKGKETIELVETELKTIKGSIIKIWNLIIKFFKTLFKKGGK